MARGRLLPLPLPLRLETKVPLAQARVLQQQAPPQQHPVASGQSRLARLEVAQERAASPLLRPLLQAMVVASAPEARQEEAQAMPWVLVEAALVAVVPVLGLVQPPLLPAPMEQVPPMRGTGQTLGRPRRRSGSRSVPPSGSRTSGTKTISSIASQRTPMSGCSALLTAS